MLTANVTGTETDVKLSVELTIAGKGIEYNNSEKTSLYRAYRVLVTFAGSTRAEALEDDNPAIKVVEGYRVKLNGFRGAKAGTFNNQIGWYNTTDLARLQELVAIARAHVNTLEV